MRHINKDMDNPIARAQLESANYCNDVQQCVANNKGDFKSKKYGHDIVRDELKDIYHDKCCYCEVKIRPVATPNVEHFRPQRKITGVNNNGYYWLGYEWSNLLLACPACNGAKGTKFPLSRNNHVVNHPEDKFGNIDYTLFSIKANYHNQERPLLINPEIMFPERMMYFDYFCRLLPISENIFAVTTIREIELNRNDLVADRQEKVDKIILRIEQQIEAKYNGYTDAQFQEQLGFIFKDIVARSNPIEEYSLLGQNMIERFAELILEDIEPVFRDTILDYFIDFLNDL
jgi:5-methylcytosine-specific restriction endonuclease McrA